MGAPLLSCKDVVVEYKTRRGALRAVDTVSLDIREGETVALVGESGSGKSTLGKAIVGLEPIRSGSIKLNGTELGGLSRRAMRPYRQALQMVFQDPFGSLNPRLSIGRIIEEPMLVHRIGTAEERRRRVAELLERVGLSAEMMTRYPHEFSGGQRQRIVIARALTLNPKLIICDEPVSALDVSVQAQVLNLLADLQRDLGLSYLFVSHDLSVVRHIAHRVVVMYLGKFVSTGERANFWDSPIHPYTRRLLESTPSVDAVGAPLVIGAGDNDEIPSAMNPPSGCRFRTRCDFAADICAQSEPALRPVGAYGMSACHRVETLASGAVRYGADENENIVPIRTVA
ncbi:Oligopeptide transport ATP-binding protein OppF [Oceanibacterium hippocampi]|uniref:Oligopeptide transport ATP-binding protein OppF n=2 Tax=Oceanibacterium hippocampi TaxID=745714 RepID=A0A1Y5RW30_9PROT|nr:Oligopeptide transport ATP-binding protein OppF [Oceanibacterium hippocampi]